MTRWTWLVVAMVACTGKGSADESGSTTGSIDASDADVDADTDADTDTDSTFSTNTTDTTTTTDTDTDTTTDTATTTDTDTDTVTTTDTVTDTGTGTVSTTTQPVFSSGTLVIDGTWSADMDAGAEVLSGDWFWEQISGTQRQISPTYPALIAVMGTSPVGYADCAAAYLSSAPVDGSDPNYSDMPVGTWLCVLTDEGRYSAFVITAIDPALNNQLTLDYTTWGY